MDPRYAYNELPELPPPSPLETPAVLKACIGARAALAELKTAADLIPNQAVLINVVPLLEARASTEVENIVTTNDALFRQAAMSDGRADPATKEALNYRGALLAGFESQRKRPLCTATAEEVCSVLKGTRMAVRRVPGVRLANHRTGEVMYTPPEGEDLLRAKLANWERFLHDHRELDPLVRMAAGHYQFEAIHPFTDGNGRTGRILNLLFLVNEGLLREPVLYLSRYILRNRAEYYERLLGVTREGAWEPWLLYMIRGVEEMALWTRRKIEAIRGLIGETVGRLRAIAPEIYSRELVEAVFTQAYCRIGNLVDAGVAKRQTASVYLRRLAVLGFVREVESGRERLYVNEAFARLLFTDHEGEPSVVREEPLLHGPPVFPRAVERVWRAEDMPRPGKPHEITGVGGLRPVLGTDRRAGSLRWIMLREESPPEQRPGRFTWYDARARSSSRTGRSEWRLYCEDGIPSVQPGDLLIVTTDGAGEIAGFLTNPSSRWLRSLRHVLGLPGGASEDSAATRVLTEILDARADNTDGEKAAGH